MLALLLSWGYCVKRQSMKTDLFSIRCHMWHIHRIFTLLEKNILYLCFVNLWLLKRLFWGELTTVPGELHRVLYFCGEVFLHISSCYPTFTHLNPHTYIFHADFKEMFVIAILTIKTRKNGDGVIRGRGQEGS